MPLHPPEFALVNNATRYGPAQSYSVAVHVGIACALLLLFAHTSQTPPFLKLGPMGDPGHFILPYAPPPELREGQASLGRHGGGGEEEPLPARVGHLVPPSRMPLVPPRLPHTQQIDLPAPPAVFDPNAPANAPLVTNLGLPWMQKDTNSAGPGKGHTIGNHGQNGMGDDDGEEAGWGDTPGNYTDVVSHALCLYCPEPPYSDEARKAKLQGVVTLRVLIGNDGRARRVQVVKGLGMGLDESAVEAVQRWHFAPARDARRQPLATWVTIETHFQLF